MQPQPFSREALVDRRQPTVRWSAIVAGAVTTLGAWLMFQLLFTGGALASVKASDLDAARSLGVGSTAASVLAALVAMFAGGLLAGKLAAHYDQRVVGLHGILVWALASSIGMLMMASAMSGVASDWPSRAPLAGPPSGSAAQVEQALEPINARLRSEGRPEISVGQFIEAAQHAATHEGTYDREAFISHIDATTSLSRTEAEAVVRDLGDRAPTVIAAAHVVGEYRAAAVKSVRHAGRSLIGAGLTLLLCLAAAVGGALLSLQTVLRRRRQDTEPGVAQPPPATPESGPAAAPPERDERSE
ncbi:MAG: hypothetical protein ACTHU0_12815 [Kofleriaceae bacterium]